MNSKRIAQFCLCALTALGAACTSPKPAPAVAPEGGSHAAPQAVEQPESDQSVQGGNWAPPADREGADGPRYAEPTPPAPSNTERKAAAPRGYAEAGGGALSEDGDSMRAAPHDKAGGSWSGPLAPTKNERPGLGTEWGEDRYAPVHATAFVRRDAERPMATLRAFYNDRMGTEAAANGVWRDPTANMGAGPVSMVIEDGSGAAFDRSYFNGGWHVVGEKGARYVISLHNHSAQRVEAVLTVDGLDVITGRAGSLQQRGYVILPYGDLQVEGFRRSDSEVASFRFGSVKNSYVAKTGTDRNVGVIGLALFDEREPSYVRPRPVFRPYTPPSPYIDPYDVRRRESANPFPSDARYAQPPR